MIQNELDIPADQQTLTYEDDVLEDDSMLSDYKIQGGDTLNVIITEASYNVVLLHLCANWDEEICTTLEVQGSFTIDHVKSLAFLMSNSKDLGFWKELKLFFDGQQLQDELTLS